MNHLLSWTPTIQIQSHCSWGYIREQQFYLEHQGRYSQTFRTYIHFPRDSSFSIITTSGYTKLSYSKILQHKNVQNSCLVNTCCSLLNVPVQTQNAVEVPYDYKHTDSNVLTFTLALWLWHLLFQLHLYEQLQMLCPTLKQDALYKSWTTWPMLVLEACGKCGSNLWTTNMTRTFRDRAEPSSKASKTNFRTSSCIAEKCGTISVFKTREYMLLNVMVLWTVVWNGGRHRHNRRRRIRKYKPEDENNHKENGIKCQVVGQVY